MLAMSLDCFAERLLVTHGQVVALLADQNLADRFAAHRSFDRILDIADVDSVAVGGRAIHDQIHVGLAAHLKCAEIGYAWNFSHDVLISSAFGFENLQVGRRRF